MNFPRVAMAALVAWIADLLYGYVVFGILLADSLAQNAAVFRSAEQMSGFLPIGFASSLFGYFVFAYIYAKGYEGGSGAQEGLRFGVLIGLLLISFCVVWSYVTTHVSGSFTGQAAVATLIEFIITGTIVGLLYKPLGTTRRPASV